MGGPTTLDNILNEKYKLVEYQKKRGYKGLCSICLTIEDFTDRSDLMHHNANLLSQLFLRGRRLFLSTLVSSQGLKFIASSFPANLQFICIWRLRSLPELDSLLGELSAVHAKRTLLAVYESIVVKKLAPSPDTLPQTRLTNSG